MSPTALSRRDLLTAAGMGAGVLVLAGCHDSVDGAPADAATQTTGSADLELARRTARRVATLVGALAGAAGEHRELREVLNPLEARHREHVRAFTPDGETVRFPKLAVPRTPVAALDAVASAERRAAVATRDAAVRASSGELASALASAAACMAQHVVLLEAARDDERGGS